MNTYWNNKGRYQVESKVLEGLIPKSGKIEDKPALERYRVACNCYYDYYNNALCNRAEEFKTVFGFNGKRKPMFQPTDLAQLEAAMDQIVLAAYREHQLLSKWRALFAN